MRVLRVSHSAVVDAWRERERELRIMGMTVHLLSAKTWNEGGVPVRLRPRPDEDVVGVGTLGSHPALFLYDPRELWRTLGSDWDVLDIHEEPFALATAEVLAIRWLRRAVGRKPLRAPFVVYSAQNIYKRYPWPFGWLERSILRRAAAICVCNVEAGRIARIKGLRGRVELIPLGIDPRAFSPRKKGRATDATAGYRVGYVGRLEAHKGVDVLVAAVAGDKHLELDIVGDGPMRTRLERGAEDLNGRVRLLGALDTADLPAFYRSVDVLAVPSLETPGWIEQFGRAALEAMACGTPVVASNSGALPDVVGRAGVLVPPGDPVALREALRRVVHDPVLATELRKRGFEIAEQCTWKTVARRYRAMYEAITVGSVGVGAPPPTPNSQPPEVLLVAYGAPELVRQALAPLAAAFPITVIDNSSLAVIEEIAGEVGARYVDAGGNKGFAAGVNVGLAHRQAPGRDVLLLNPDAVISARGVLALQAALHVESDIASVGPRQVDRDGRPSRVAWPFPHPAGSWLEAVGFGRFRRRHDFIIGSVLLVNSAALDDVGDFDQRFFLYAEETDWAMRASRLGWRHVVVPGVSAVHTGAGTSTDSARRETHFHASQEKFYRKHFGASGWCVARAAALFGSAVRGILRGPDAGAADRRRFGLYWRGPIRAETLLPEARTPGGVQ